MHRMFPPRRSGPPPATVFRHFPGTFVRMCVTWPKVFFFYRLPKRLPRFLRRPLFCREDFPGDALLPPSPPTFPLFLPIPTPLSLPCHPSFSFCSVPYFYSLTFPIRIVHPPSLTEFCSCRVDFFLFHSVPHLLRTPIFPPLPPTCPPATHASPHTSSLPGS